MSYELTRRAVLAAVAALPFATAARSQEFTAAGFRVGGFEVVALRDGLFPLALTMIPDANGPEGKKLMAAAGLPADGPSPEPVNAFLIRRDGKLTLLDAGCGTVLGPGFNQVIPALQAAGVAPAQVETVWLTHLHADHAGGLLAPNGGAAFPNAEIVVQEVEFAYWSDAGNRSRAPADMATFFDIALAVLAAYKGRVRRVTGTAELAPGATSIPLPGHTPGHAGILLADGSEKSLIWGDVLHSRVLQLPHPDWTVIWDNDPAQAIATRKRVLDMAAADRLTVTGMHLASRGRIERRGDGYILQSA